jgi:putative ABC transport system permease protein
MIRNYFKSAWRNLFRNKFYSAINIAGLSIGLAVGIMVLLWVKNELSYDSFHTNAANIYKINSHLGAGEGAQVWDGSPGPLAVFSKQVPEVKQAVRVNAIYEQFLFTYGDKKFKESRLAYVDSGFFSVFDYKLLQGNPENPFPDMHSIVINESAAKKYFANKRAVGQVLVNDYGNFTVTGVVEDFPENSFMQYDMLLPMSLYADMFFKWGGNGSWKTIDEDLGNFPYHTYLQLQPDASPEKVGQKLTQVFREKKGHDAKDDFFALQTLKSLHLVAADGGKSALETVRIFLIVAILVLCIACINYVNLSTARAMVRSREVSVRKIIGAARWQLFIQFILESVLIFLLASLLAFVLIYLLLPLYNDLSGKQLLFSLANQNVWLVVGSAVAGSLLLASFYPALLLSSFKPIQLLRGKFSLGISNAAFRKILVVTQFVFSIGLIIGTIVISFQLRYIREKDLGFNKDQVFSLGMTKELHDHYDAARAELLKQAGIISIAASNNNIVGVGGTTSDTDWDGKETGRVFFVHPNAIDNNLIPLLKMKMIAGDNFTGTKADSTHFILNETAIKQAAIKDPIGKRFQLWETKGIITGVVKDFNYASLKQAIEPTVFYYNPPHWTMYVKTTGKDASKAIAAVEKVWKSYNAEFPFEFAFLDDQFSKMYSDDQRTGTLFNVFAVIAILISCLGLFGLATYTAHVRIKEIGIRKVLGASVAGITRLLAKDFVQLVLIAFVIATPVAWIGMNKWLQNYAYRVDIAWWIFIITGLLAILIALITVSFQAIKAALANPVSSLRTE